MYGQSEAPEFSIPKGHVLPERSEDDLPRAAEAVRNASLDIPMMTTAITDPRDLYTEPILKTAHQLGTPTSSMLGWVEILMEKHPDKNLIRELGKDASRLEKITERFSKIGSKPVLKMESIMEVVMESVDYLRTRTSKQVEFQFEKGKALQKYVREGIFDSRIPKIFNIEPYNHQSDSLDDIILFSIEVYIRIGFPEIGFVLHKEVDL